MLKSRNIQTLRASKSRILKINNAKFSECYFYMNTNIQGDFQICISLPLIIRLFWLFMGKIIFRSAFDNPGQNIPHIYVSIRRYFCTNLIMSLLYFFA